MNIPKPLPSQDELRRCFNYDKNTGILKWKNRLDRNASWNSKWAGKETGYKTAIGYKTTRFNHIIYHTHRIVFKWFYGIDPDIIDHDNGDGYDNRICNLKNGDFSKNQRNMILSKKSKSGVTGVYFDKRRNIYSAYIGGNSSTKRLNIGSYGTLAEAKKAREDAEIKLGFSCLHGYGKAKPNKMRHPISTCVKQAQGGSSEDPKIKA